MIRKRTLALALDYVEKHFGVRYLFPIKPGAKFPPLIRDNLAQASNDPVQLAAWERHWPGCNWGLSHKRSGVLVADIDVNKAKGKIGDETYLDLDLIYGWPETEMTTTPSGGFHKIYIGPHIMALGENGIGKDIDSPNYSVIPGCTLDDGTSYVGNDVDAVKCPKWIYDTIKNSKAKSRIADAGDVVVELDQERNIETAIDFLLNDAIAAIEGSGGDFNTLKTAMYLKDLGISPQLAPDLLNEYYNPRCEPPWDIDDLIKKVTNAYNYATLSKVGGKTAEADFADDPPPPITQMGIYDIKKKKHVKAKPAQTEAEIAKRNEAARDRRATAKAEADVPPDEVPKKWTKPEVLEAFVWVSSIERFIKKKDTKVMWKKSAFDAHFSHLNTAKGAPKSYADCLFKLTKGTISRFEELVFKPGMPQVIDGRQFNTYTQPTVIAAEGDVTWWDEHLAYLFPNEIDRNHLLNWLAWLVQNIQLKPKHALLMQGPIQGTGKSFVLEVFSQILHPKNVKNISQSDLHNQFNGWAIRSKLLVVEELRAGDRTEVANKLHPLITQETISVNEKNVPQQEIDNCFGIAAMTNSDAAIPIDNTDRRYLVLRTDAVPRAPSYYAQLYGRLDDPAALAAVAFSLENRDIGEYSGQQAAPMTAAKEDMKAASMNDLDDYLIDGLVKWPLNGRLVCVDDVILNLPKRLETKSTRLVSAIKAFLMRNGAIALGQCTTPKGERPRLYAMGPQAKFIALQARTFAGKTYEEDNERARKNQPPNDLDASEEFADTDDVQ